MLGRFLDVRDFYVPEEICRLEVGFQVAVCFLASYCHDLAGETDKKNSISQKTVHLSNQSECKGIGLEQNYIEFFYKTY